MIGPYHLRYDQKVFDYLDSEDCVPHRTCLMDFFEEIQKKPVGNEAYLILRPTGGEMQKRIYLISACKHLVELRDRLNENAFVDDLWLGATALAIQLWGEKV